jgi:hypothetical protein
LWGSRPRKRETKIKKKADSRKQTEQAGIIPIKAGRGRIDDVLAILNCQRSSKNGAGENYGKD